MDSICALLPERRVLEIEMMRVLLVVLGSVAAFAAAPSTAKPGSCVTPQGTICRTIRWTVSGWENRSWGFHAVARWNGTAVLAYSRDGRELERYSQTNYRYHLVPEGSWDRGWINIPALDRRIRMDYLAKEYGVGPAGGSNVWDSSDTDCSKMASAFLLSDLKRVGTEMIAGVKSTEYEGSRPPNVRWAVWLAPSLGCTQMKVITSGRNVLGLPTIYTRLEAVSVQIGEPNAALFEIPQGFLLGR